MAVASPATEWVAALVRRAGETVAVSMLAANSSPLAKVPLAI
eukprot:CAMPEP_0171091812 /NCGR_PEP_ID=MMETSP0766_2-20121228/35337_1 /TAXON_ID=439317 /ORGANISM="Gambierdiscus australes, Strain CAWD 149" /LENGTH=41 /DNA_ID= /DNA_START= /DNA_END= /DNA_ORIENTATION=